MAEVDQLTQEVAAKLRISPEEHKDGAESAPEPYYTLSERHIYVTDMTRHTIRQAWILLEHSLDYKLGAYVPEGELYPEAKELIKYAKYSSMAYVYGCAVGVILCDVVKYEWPPTSKKSFGKGTGRPKPEPYAIVVLALGVLPKYRGVNLSKRMLDHTLKRASDARIFKLFAFADAQGEGRYTKAGFSQSDNTTVTWEENKATDADGGPCKLSLLEYTVLN